MREEASLPVRTAESSLWNWLKKATKQLSVRHHVHRVENDVESGDPDVEGCIDGCSFHVELKVAERFTKAGTFEVRMKSAQAYWAHHRVEAGGRAWVLIRVGVDHYLLWGGDVLDFYLERALGTPGRLTKLTADDLRRLSRVDPSTSAVDLLRFMSTERPVQV